MREKFRIEWQVCANCGSYLFPPSEVSDVGVEDYVEEWKAPLAEPESVPTTEELNEINRARQEAGLIPFASVDEWMADYRGWAQEFRTIVRAWAQSRYDELSSGPPKVRELQLVEEAKAFKLIGKRWLAGYEETPEGWRLKCPNCNSSSCEWQSG